jgi:hypothetical protein
MSRPDFSTRGRRPETRTADQAFLGVSALALALALASAAAAWSDLRRVQGDLAKTRTETEAVALAARDREARKGPDAVLSARALWTADSPPPRVLADLETLLPADVRLLSLDLDYGERLELGLRIAARRAPSYDLFLQRMQQSPLFADVRPGEEVRDGGVRAQVRAAYRGRRP